MRAALRATYQIDLDNPGMSVAHLAQHVIWLPPGCALWISVGGPLAWSADQRILNAVEFRLRVLDWRKTKSKTKPLPVADPPYAHERAQQDASIQRKADAYLRRQRKKAQPKGD